MPNGAIALPSPYEVPYRDATNSSKEKKEVKEVIEGIDIIREVPEVEVLEVSDFVFSRERATPLIIPLPLLEVLTTYPKSFLTGSTFLILGILNAGSFMISGIYLIHPYFSLALIVAGLGMLVTIYMYEKGD